MMLIANKTMSYGGKVVQEGERFEASEKDARVLVGIRRASQAPDAAKAKEAPVYKTRVMKAEGTSER